jgi:hypothetical protein
MASIYQPDAEIASWWPGGSRHLAVKIDQVAVDRALEALVQSTVGSPIAFDASLPLNTHAAQDWGLSLVGSLIEAWSPQTFRRGVNIVFD